jgi:hypothetical protein
MIVSLAMHQTHPHSVLLRRGYFVKIFNSRSRDPQETPPNHEPFLIPTDEKEHHQTEFTSSSVSAVDISADAHVVLYFSGSYIICHFPSDFNWIGLGIGLKCTSHRGAALIVSKKGLKEKRINQRLAIRTYVKKHHASWLRFAEEKGQQSEKIFVRGCSKAQNWLAVAFKGESVERSISLSASSTRSWLQGSRRTRVSNRYNFGPEQTLVTVSQDGDAMGVDRQDISGNPIQVITRTTSLGESIRGFDQCVFIERYCVKQSQSLKARVLSIRTAQANIQPPSGINSMQPGDARCINSSSAPHASQQGPEPGASETSVADGTNELHDSGSWVELGCPNLIQLG